MQLHRALQEAGYLADAATFQRPRHRTLPDVLPRLDRRNPLAQPSRG